jgi:nitroreductase
MAPHHESAETLLLISQRRSTPVAMLVAPGPSPADVDYLLSLAARAPDHRKLEPWRFHVYEGDRRKALADIFASARLTANTGASQAELDQVRALPMRAPVVIAVVSAPVVDDPKKTPVWEQQLSAGAVCQNLMLAACAAGWAACWITEEQAYDPHVHAALGLRAQDRIAGFICLGTAKEKPVERQRPDMSKKIIR